MKSIGRELTSGPGRRALAAGVLAVAGTLTGMPGYGAGALSDADREALRLEQAELELQIEEARAQLDEAAERLGELHGRLYAMETVGHPGQKPMLGVLVGERGPNGGLLLSGVTPGGGAQAAGLAAGDEITSVNGVELTGAKSAMARLKEAMTGVAPGDSVSVGYQRDGIYQAADITTQAKGVYIMGMAGVPAVDVDIEAIQDMAAGVAEHFANVDFSREWVESLESLENLESLEELQALQEFAPQVHHAISIAGPGGGLRLEQVSGDLASYFGVESGVLVLAAPPAPDGEEAPLKAGDVLLAVDGEPIRHPGDGFRTLLGPNRAADGAAEEITVEVMRHGVREIVRLTPDQLGPQVSSITLHAPEPPMPGGAITPDAPVESPDLPVIAPPSP